MKVVCCLAVLALLCAAVTAQPRLESVTKGSTPTDRSYYTISLRDIYVEQRGPGQARTWGRPLPSSQASPMSDRLLNLFWTPHPTLQGTAEVDASEGAGLFDALENANTFTLNFAAPFGVGATVDVKLEAPYLEIGPFDQCPEDVAGPMGSCRCNPGALNPGVVPRAYLAEADKIIANNVIPDPSATGSTVTVDSPVLPTFFEHAPFPGQNPFARTYRRLCYRVNDGNWIDTRILVSVSQGCVDGLSTADTIDPQGLARCTQRPTNNLLTVVGTTPAFVPSPDPRIGEVGSFYTYGPAGVFGTYVPQAEVEAFSGESGVMHEDRLARSVCCGSSDAAIAGPFDLGAATRFGICIDTDQAQCCGRRAYQPSTEKCCSRPYSVIRAPEQPCPCEIGGTSPFDSQLFCDFMGPNNLNIVDDRAGLTQGSSTPTFECCAQTRFAELSVATLGVEGVTFTRFQRSFCYDTAGPTDGFQCCTDGNVYDVGSQQCCRVNGVQSLNVPCPCGSNADCPTESLCCFQFFPPGLPRGQGAAQCSPYANFPRIDNGAGDQGDVVLNNLPGSAVLQRCAGTCYSQQYQMCCNGAVCERGFTRCCNDTCCNKYSETCQLSQRSPLSSLSNSRDLGVYFEMCSRIELLSGRKAFFVFVLPAWLLLATAISLAVVTVLARRATEHIFELTERAIVFLAVITVLLGCPFFFSPFYKNGIVIVLVGLVAILVAVARKRKASLFLVILLVAAICYVINPFDGNIYLSITSAVPVYGAKPESSLLEAAQNLWRTSENCVDFYDFFLYDPMHRDQRLHNPENFTFGYCSRGYITALIIFAIALYVVLLLLLLLAVFSLVKKLGIKAVEPIELEVAMEPELVY